jgi:hypothetical protein
MAGGKGRFQSFKVAGFQGDRDIGSLVAAFLGMTALTTNS